jgi:triacylglycerol lipase
MRFQPTRFAFFAVALIVTNACTESSAPDLGTLPQLTHDPILFVQGFLGNPADWSLMKARFAADGWASYELHTYSPSVAASNAVSAAEIRDSVDQIMRKTGATKVDIIAHSMGSISTRYYLKFLHGSEKVGAWVSLAGPNHGTDDVERQKCDVIVFTPCKEIVIGSAFLLALNAGIETPGPAQYATWRSPCDTTISPESSVILAGAYNYEMACVVHYNFLIDETVYQQVRDFVQRW